MTGEAPVPPEPLQAEMLHGRSLQDWHDWLVTNPDTDEDEGGAWCPGSRYGFYSDDVAWWAIAAEVVYVAANGEDDDPEASLPYLMSLAVNDHPDIASIVAEYWHQIPAVLREQLGTEEDLRELAG